MLPYWILFSVYAFGAVNYRTSPRQSVMKASPLFILAGALTVLLIGFRFEVGADWFNYIDIYYAASFLSLRDLLAYGDPGYMLINWLGRELGLDIWFVNLVCGLIFIWGLAKFAQSQPNPWLAFAVAVPYLIIVVAMGYTRQGVAIGLILAAFGPFERGRHLKFLFFIALATAFHKTAIVVLPLIALASVRHRVAVYAVAGLIGAFIFFIFLDAFLTRLLSTYFDEARSSDGAGIRVAMNVLPALLYLSFQRRFVLSEQERQIWRNFALAALAIVPLLFLLPSSTVVDRVALYLLPLQVFVLTRVPFAFPLNGRPNALLTTAVLVYSAVVQGVWLLLASHAEYWLPYRVFPIG